MVSSCPLNFYFYFYKIARLQDFNVLEGKLMHGTNGFDSQVKHIFRDAQYTV